MSHIYPQEAYNLYGLQMTRMHGNPLYEWHKNPVGVLRMEQSLLTAGRCRLQNASLQVTC